MAYEIVIFFGSMSLILLIISLLPLPVLRKERGIIYMLTLRVLVMLCMFIAFSMTASYATVITSSPSINATTSYTYYYFQPVNSLYNSTDHYYKMGATNYNSITNLTFLLPNVPGHYEIAKFITNSTSPNQSIYTPGIYQVHVHAATNNNTPGGVQLYSEVWIMGPNDNNLYMIGRTALTPQLQANDSEYISNFYNNQTIATNASNRLAVYLFANYTASFGTPANVFLYLGQYANPHLSVPTAYHGTSNTIQAIQLSSTDFGILGDFTTVYIVVVIGTMLYDTLWIFYRKEKE